MMEDQAEDQVYYYTQISTSNIYEVKFFDGFVIARLPTDCRHIKKIDIKTFAKEFDLYAGDHTAVEEALQTLDILAVN